MTSTLKSISIGCDHAGVALKNKTKSHLEARGWAVIDCGTHDDVSVDYPDFARKVGQDVADGEAKFGVLICGSGIGMAIAANKINGVRAACVWNAESTRLSREHNDANVIAIGTRMMDDAAALACVDIFLATEFAGGRHCGRVAKIETSIEN